MKIFAFSVFVIFCAMCHLPQQVEIYAVYRPDITKKESGVEMIGVAASKGDECESDYTPWDPYLAYLKTLSGQIFGVVDNIDWKNKKEGKYDGEKCTVYYDDDEKDYALYVKDDYPIAMHAYSTDLIFDWEWSAPMKKFKLDACKDDFGKTPSDDYVFCAAASVKVAVVALLVALVSSKCFLSLPFLFKLWPVASCIVAV